MNYLSKKTLPSLILLLSLAIYPLLAQETEVAAKKKFPVELRIGFTSASFDTPYNNENTPSPSKAGFYLGAIVDCPLSKTVCFQPGLVLISKGGKLNVNTENDKALTVNGVYLQLPLYFSFKLPLRRYDNSLNFNFGPYLAYAIAGKTSYKPSGSNTSTSLDSFGNLGPLNRLDAGLGLEFQFELKHKVVFTLGSEMGMTRSMKKEWISGTNDLIANSTNYLSVGYKF
jgi:Outer membrane protein beta-barrel domain